MRVLGLDISTKTGYAILDDGVLLIEGLLIVDKTINLDLIEDLQFLLRAKSMATQIHNLIQTYQPDKIFIEQTNAGKFRSSQKQLEFIHCSILNELYTSFSYLNKFAYVDTSKWRSSLGVKLTKDQRKHNKSVKAKLVRGKITPKHLTVTWANETFGLQLKLKDNDRADALAIATFGERYGANQIAAQYDIDNILLNK